MVRNASKASLAQDDELSSAELNGEDTELLDENGAGYDDAGTSSEDEDELLAE